MKNPEFVSTRDGGAKISFWDSVIKGLANDGGLLVPTEFPKLSKNKINDTSWWKKSNPADFAYEALRLFVPTNIVSDAELKKDMKLALNFPLPLEKNIRK